MIDVSVLVDKLNGMTTAEVREFLFRERVQGYQQESHSCPIANWIRQHSGQWVDVQSSVRVLGPDCDDESIAEYKLSMEVDAFISNFDSGEYPELVLPPESYGLEPDYG